MSNSEHFHSNIDSREYRINYSFNCDSSNVVYLLECTVCGVQYVGSTCTPFPGGGGYFTMDKTGMCASFG